MANANYTTLIAARSTAGSIKEFVNNDNIPVATIFSDAESWLYSKLKVRQMLKSATGTLTTSNDTIALPTDFKKPNFFMFTASSTVSMQIPELREHDQVFSAWSYDGTGARVTGRPQSYFYDAANIQFEKRTDRDYPYLLRYYAALPALSTATATNFLTSEYPHLLRAACATFAFEWAKDMDRAKYWLQVAEKEVFEANSESDQAMEGADLRVEIA